MPRANELRILSFNYDRSLEYFLYQSTGHHYGLSYGTDFNTLGVAWQYRWATECRVAALATLMSAPNVVIAPTCPTMTDDPGQ
jgi:hypothetical protein